MNDIVNKFLPPRDKFILELHLGQPGLTYSAYAPFPKNKKRIQKIYSNRRYVMVMVSVNI